MVFKNDTEQALAPLDAPLKTIGMEVDGVAEKIFLSMRQKIRDVFPDTDTVAWTRTTETFEVVEIARPADAFAQWHAESFANSNEFSQLFSARMFQVWQQLETEGFMVNGDELWEHQKALFAWTTLNICTGNREQVANLLIRSPYGSGKSKVIGLIARAFRDAQLDLMLHQGVDHTKIPTGALIGKKKVHMLQNATGPQFSVIQVENLQRGDIRQYWRDLTQLYGTAFTNVFTQPKGNGDPFYAIFESDEEEVDLSAEQRIERYENAVSRSIGQKKGIKKQMYATLLQLIRGEIVLIPNEENVPQSCPSQLRADQLTDESLLRFTGDAAHALIEGEHYRVKTSHKHLAPDRSRYTTKLNSNDPAQFAIVYGSAITRVAERIREDIREEVARRCALLLLDEAGMMNPLTAGSSIQDLTGAAPLIVGVTGQDKGIEMWNASPTISEQRMIELDLMKPIAYTNFGDPINPPSAGSEEAWNDYRAMMFTDDETAELIGVDSVKNVDLIVVLKQGRVHEYATRIRNAHKEEALPVQIFVLHTDAGDRKAEIIKAFNAPKKPGEPRRVLVSSDGLVSDALTMPNVHCIDVLDVVYDNPMDQLRGRLGHVRNNLGSLEERQNARTRIRQQNLHQGRDPYVRTVAKQQGYKHDVPDEDAGWIDGRLMIGGEQYIQDGKRPNIGKPHLIPDTPKAWRRKQKMSDGPTAEFVGQPLIHINLYSHAKNAQKLRRAEQRALRSPQPTMVSALAIQAAPGTAVVSPQPNQGDDMAQVKADMPLAKHLGTNHTATIEGHSITITVGTNGMLTDSCLQNLAQPFLGYAPAFRRRVKGSYDEGIRGDDLATAVLQHCIALQETIARRSNFSVHDDTKYMNVRVSK